MKKQKNYKNRLAKKTILKNILQRYIVICLRNKVILPLLDTFRLIQACGDQAIYGGHRNADRCTSDV